MIATSPHPLESSFRCEGWRCHVLAEVPSTNSHCKQAPAWSAVRAIVQTEGRGRGMGRNWVSDEGGLWLSAVLPCPGSRAKWAILPMAAGWAVIDALRDLGVTGARLRWPNDVMVGSRKLAGLLVERFTSDTAVVGLGLNVFNHPEMDDPTLEGATARLADLAPGAYTVDDVARVMLRALRRVHAQLLDGGFRDVADELNRSWKRPRRVRVTFTSRAHVVDGFFQGVDQNGRLCLSTEREGLQVLDASHVALLRELE